MGVVVGRGVALVVVLCLGGLVFVGGSQAGKGGKTYAYTNEYVKNFGYTETLQGKKKPGKIGYAASSYVFLETKTKGWKNWGGAKAKAKVKKQRICFDPSLGKPCSESKKGKLTLKRPTKLDCEVKPGKMKKIYMYRKVIAKNPKKKGKTAEFKATFRRECPQEF